MEGAYGHARAVSSRRALRSSTICCSPSSGHRACGKGAVRIRWRHTFAHARQTEAQVLREGATRSLWSHGVRSPALCRVVGKLAIARPFPGPGARLCSGLVARLCSGPVARLCRELARPRRHGRSRRRLGGDPGRRGNAGQVRRRRGDLRRRLLRAGGRVRAGSLRARPRLRDERRVRLGCHLRRRGLRFLEVVSGWHAA